MAKGMTQKKTTKKQPAKSLKEKRADKIAKKRANTVHASVVLTEATPTAPIDVRQAASNVRWWLRVGPIICPAHSPGYAPTS